MNLTNLQFEQSFASTFNSDLFFDQVAQECGKEKLSSDEGDIAFRMREQAIKSFEEEQKPTLPPCSNLVGQVSWLITQNKLVRRNSR